MGKAKTDNKSYEKLKSDLSTGHIGKCYIFHGQEKYLLHNSLTRLRAALCLDGLDSFNYKRFDNNNFSIDMLEQAVELLPFTADRTLVEIHDMDFFKCAEDDRERISSMLADLPDHICVVIVYGTIDYSPDKRMKTTKEILKYAQVVEFTIQEESKLASWIIEHFRRAGKEINRTDAIYMAHITGGLMTSLHGEIEKVAAFSKTRQIERSDIDAVVVPVLDAVVYKLTDAIIKRENRHAMQILDELMQMNRGSRHFPNSLLLSISYKLQHLLAARVCIDNGVGKPQYMKMCGIPWDFQADLLLRTAKKTTLEYCRRAVLICTQTANELNSSSISGDPELRIVELISKLAFTC